MLAIFSRGFWLYDQKTDRLYVADTQNHAVKVFDKDGRPLFAIGKRGVENGEFNFRVQMFDANGKFLKKFGELGDTSGTFARPAGIGVNSDGNIYVVDTSFNNFQIFNNDGKLLLWIGNSGRKPGEFYLPSGLYVDNQDRIYVADTFNKRVQVFQYLKEPK